MAENFVRGKDGLVYLNGNVQARITNWTMNMAAPVEDVTDFGSSGQEFEYTGLANFSGTLTAEMLVHDTATTQELHLLQKTFEYGGTLAKSTVRFKESSRSKWSGTVLFTNFGKSAPAQGLQTFSADWVSNGRMSWASAT